MTASSTPAASEKVATRAADLEDRLVRFAVDSCEVARKLRAGEEALTIRRQLSRSGTAPAAAYAEARGAESARDYVHKMQVCLKELRETLVWLKVASGLGFGGEEALRLQRECHELIAISVTCIKKAKMRYTSKED